MPLIAAVVQSPPLQPDVWDDADPAALAMPSDVPDDDAVTASSDDQSESSGAWEQELELADETKAATKTRVCEKGDPAAGEQVTLTATDATIPGRTVAIVPANACRLAKSGGRFRERAASTITHVVIHMIERSAYASSIENWRIGGGRSCCKPHYAVSKKGEITQIVAEKHVTLHGHGTNAYSVGIEHEGFSGNPDDLTEALYLASAALTRDICRRYNIPRDGAHIVGHDMAAGNCSAGTSCHGDPGGYWDWEYYLALVKWDGTARTRPIRMVIDTSSSGFRAGSGWSSKPGRRTGSGGPHPSNSWSRNYFLAKPDAKATGTDSAWFAAVIPAGGRYEVSLWWPALQANNTATRVRCDKQGHLSGTLGVQQIAQNDHRIRSRRTRALPHTPMWKSLGELDCVQGNVIWVEISRNSANRGQIVADAVRVYRKS